MDAKVQAPRVYSVGEFHANDFSFIHFSVVGRQVT